MPDSTIKPEARRDTAVPAAENLLDRLRWHRPVARQPKNTTSRVVRSLLAGRTPVQADPAPVVGKLVTLGGDACYQIANYDRMRPFLMSIVSPSDHWMFISSTGALTAGRRDPDLALFPYYTEDKIHDAAETTGSKTILVVRRRGGAHLWEPFSERYRGIYRLRRNLYKNLCGNLLIFEEHNEDLGLTFSYSWSSSHRFGFVRRARLTNAAASDVRVLLLDGIQNLLPCGAGSQFQLEKSGLLDAYKKNELVPATGLGLFRLSSIPTDRPEPAEALRTTTVWSLGLADTVKLLSSVQLDDFRRGLPVSPENDVRAERGAYFVQTELVLRGGGTQEWGIVADVNQGPCDVVELNQLLRRPARLQKLLEKDLGSSTRDLEQIVAGADGLQKTAQPLGSARHFANVLFNVMRGGVFCQGYRIDPADLLDFVRQANREVAARHEAFFRKLSPVIHYAQLVDAAARTGDGNLERLCREYLPLTLSRRHGDPSRPWNRFSIVTHNPDGSRALNYEGNWRDIFQNWEALGVSFPGFTSGMVCKFVNASTADGYNPYRISRKGIDWEVVDPSDPWSHIGYWGDHQVIYLLKLLENLQQHDPDTLRDFLARDIFCYANVPYRIKPFEQLIANPKQTVVFDDSVAELVHSRVQSRGSDGKLMWDAQGNVRLVNLTEKLLVILLAKFSNFVPQAGIWLNTQRPEWNDANNALVGHGVSMVTLYHMRRFLAFCLKLLAPLSGTCVDLSEEVASFLVAARQVLQRHRSVLGVESDDRSRRRIFDALGRAGSRYRESLYSKGLSGLRSPNRISRIIEFLKLALEHTDDAVRANRRSDGLYHSYNLASFERKSVLPVRRLYEMLEGQVAVLSSGCLSAEESLEVLSALKNSAMYRPDQQSYLLYPDRQLPRFLEMNNIPRQQVARSQLLQKLAADGNRLLVERDVTGAVHFSGSIMNARDVGRILDQLALAGYGPYVRTEKALVLEIFELVTNHQSFTGRSGTFFGYEGLGCIYWHMVSKLLLAVQETYFRAVAAGASSEPIRQLEEYYYDIRAGLGDYKAPDRYGAFPMDPYSHTPKHAGARQPGLTGQVKEDVLCRWGELGVFVENGCLHFRPLLLRREEFLKAPESFEFHDVTGTWRAMQLPAGSLAFTCCQVPIIYRLDRCQGVTLFSPDGATQRSDQLCLSAAISRSIFQRAGKVSRLEVAIRLNR